MTQLVDMLVAIQALTQVTGCRYIPAKWSLIASEVAFGSISAPGIDVGLALKLESFWI